MNTDKLRDFTHLDFCRCHSCYAPLVGADGYEPVAPLWADHLPNGDSVVRFRRRPGGYVEQVNLSEGRLKTDAP